jgi:regulation of enolase protein 1 (concanavalin A-like superfamily)
VIPNNKVAVLTTSGLTVGQNVNVTVKNVKEAFNPANAINGTTGATVAHTISGRKWAAVGGQEAGFTPDAAGMGGSAATGWNYDVVSGGIGFWDVYDEGTFVYDDITGDFDKAVRVEYQDPSSHWARCGLMVREALDEDKPRAAGGMSRYQQIFVDPTTKYDCTAANNAHEFNQRLTAGGATTGATVTGPNGPPPYPNAWIRMKREGSQITMYRGNDGVNWTQMSQMTFSPDLAATAAVGLIYSPENANIPVDSGLRAAYMAKFRNYKDIGTIVPQIRITITKSAGGVTISWTGDNGLGKLYSSATADGVFTEVVGATNGGEQPAATGDRFYLIRRP